MDVRCVRAQHGRQAQENSTERHVQETKLERQAWEKIARAPSAGKHSTSPKHGKTAHERQKQNNITQEPSAEKHSTVSEREERVRFSHYLQF